MEHSNLAEYGVATLTLGILAYALKLFHASYLTNTKAITRLTTSIKKQIEDDKEITAKLCQSLQDTQERIKRLEERL